MSLARQIRSLYRGQGELVDTYGVILYSDAHAHVKKVLKDRDYWAALHALSGDRWAVFAAQPAEGSWDTAKPDPGSMGMMIRAWREPSENAQLLEEFELESTKDLPALLVFAVDQHTGALLRVTFDIDDATVEAAYDSIKSYVVSVARIISRIEPSYRFNAREMHRLIEAHSFEARGVRTLRKTIDRIRALFLHTI